MNQGSNPIWNQTFDFVVEDAVRDMLIVEAWDQVVFTKVAYFNPFNLLYS